MCNAINNGFQNNFGNFGGCGMGGMNPMQMILQILLQALTGMMGGGAGGCGAGGGCGQGNCGFSPNMSPGFGGGGCGGCGGGGMPNFGGPSGNFLGGGPGHHYGGNPGYGPSGPGYGPSGPGGVNRSGNGLGTNHTGAVGNLGSGKGSDAVRWALSQEGVSESRNPDVVRGYSRGRWQAWCADFVSSAYERSGGSPFGHQSSVQGILNWGRNNPGHFIGSGAARSNPGALSVGDVAVWKQNGRSHVGLVTGVNRNGTFNTIEGNTSDRVARRTHSFGDRSLTGFVRPNGTYNR